MQYENLFSQNHGFKTLPPPKKKIVNEVEVDWNPDEPDD